MLSSDPAHKTLTVNQILLNAFSSANVVCFLFEFANVRKDFL